MTTKIFALHDGKAKFFQVPFFMPTVGMALRGFQDLCLDPQTMVYKHPEDFTLYEIGAFDDQTATFIPLSPINLIATATEYAPSKPALIKEA